MLELYKDKVLHGVAGLIVGSLVLIVARHFAPPPVNSFFAVIGAAFAGACKEGWDYLDNKRHAMEPGWVAHDVSLWDALATTAGGLVVAIVYSLSNR
jgi:xanthosine utilization system XapX-like protein